MGDVKSIVVRIRNSKEKIEKFKLLGFEFYKTNNKLNLYSFGNFFCLTLLNMKSEYEKTYGTLLTPPEEYIIFYKKKSGSVFENSDSLPNDDAFSVRIDSNYYNLLFSLMHTYYINSQGKYTNFSISLFFDIIYSFINNHDLKFID